MSPHAKAPSGFQRLRRLTSIYALTAFDKIPQEGRDWFNVFNEPRRGIFLGRPANPLSSHRILTEGFSNKKPPRAVKAGTHSTPSQARSEVLMGSGRAAPAPLSLVWLPWDFPPGLAPPAQLHPRIAPSPAPSSGYHAGGPGGRDRRALSALSAAPPEEVC